MKTRRLTAPIIAALMAAFVFSGCSSSESKVTLADLPAAVQAAIKVKIGDNPIDEIEKKTKQGQVAYKVEFRKDGMKIEFMVDSDGKLVPVALDKS